MKIINLEDGRPSTIDAMTTLNNRIYAVRASGVRMAKIIHGYGSTGHGGTIRKECRHKLLEYRRRGVIKDLCAGEKFGPFDEEGRRVAAFAPEVRSDTDWGRANAGITIIFFK